MDDEQWACSLIKRLVPWKQLHLELAGIFPNGRAAVECCRSMKIDLVIADIRMPVCDGLEMAGELSQEPGPPEIILVSGYDSFDYAQKAIRYGVVDYVLKPVEPEELLKALHSALDRIITRMEREKGVSRLRKTVRKLSESEGTESAPSVQDHRIGKALEILHSAPERLPTMEETAETVFLSPQHFSVLFKREVGSSYSDYLAFLRLEKAKALLANPDLTVREIAGLCGFPDPDYFCRFFKKGTGRTPGAFREGHDG